MVRTIVAGGGVRKIGKAAAMEGKPAGDLAETLGRDRQLNRPARVGADRAGVEMTHRGAESLGYLGRDGAGKIDLVRVEVEVDVEVARARHGDDMGMLVPQQKGQLTFRRLCP